ncbi:glycosyltransferase family 2 protein [Tamlana sp. I1]|uniref:glycosyltransferase family 2 protein n=1 Tax=Tamlana sp. I1 TaxID=2762061 RepID=UPI00188E8AC6|nr:glycosyltransferase [Tamlana sp. I1]
MKGLSICIPVYNYNCIETIKILCKQIEELSINSQIIVFDDASPHDLNDLSGFKNPNYSYKKLPQNVGRSKIRNLLANAAIYNSILFLDGDSGIQDNFIKNYVETIAAHPNSVICGGRIHLFTSYPEKKLRYRYGVKFEDTKALKRNKAPYKSFMTNNFVVTKQIMASIPFNEKLNKYGHEDTFFGYELNKNHISIIHIDNAVIHLDLENSNEFIEKTKNGIENLVLLKNTYPDFISHSKLLSLIETFKILKFKPIKYVSKILASYFEKTTCKTNNIYRFQLFKLFYTITIS